MNAHRWLFYWLPFTNGGNPEPRPSPAAWARDEVAMRRSWTVTALFLLMFVVFWEVRTMMRVQPIAVSPAEVMQLAATDTFEIATVSKDHILLQRRSTRDGSLHGRARAWVGLPIDGQLMVMRSESAAEMERVRAHLAAHGVRILASEQRAR